LTAIDRHAQRIDPFGEDALDMILEQREAVIVPGGEVADVQPDAGEARNLRGLALREKPVRDAALIENLDGTGVQPPAREPASVWSARRSTMATSMPASASSPASINPVGPAPAISTA
jgi:hypothetical protein